jgi:hypothetical protein
MTTKSHLDTILEEVKKEFRNLVIKRRELITRLGSAFESVVSNPESVCEEIKNSLQEEIADRIISARDIERYCPDKWKKKTKPKNDKLSFSKPIEQKPQQQIAAANQGESVSYDEPTPYTETSLVDDTSFVAVQKSPQNRLDKLIESDLEDCPNCRDLRVSNQELEEALRKATTLSTADTLYSTADSISNGEGHEILNLEFSLPYQAVQQYMAAEFQRGKDKVWFSFKIDVKTKKVASVKTGRISELETN